MIEDTRQELAGEYNVFCPNCGEEHTVQVKQAIVEGEESGEPSGIAQCDCGFHIVVQEQDTEAVEGTFSITGYDFP